ncbi:hypothetical protein E2C01_033293 [Portunus trituberculatus]|uniref:Uncharacterized protein n=1 Tax=Portunus trituberculatus TaxID=210409 RepID=A0A5B7F225_PORTR|nr:hypothetical protein [Portunus trituberculatus]
MALNSSSVSHKVRERLEGTTALLSVLRLGIAQVHTLRLEFTNTSFNSFSGDNTSLETWTSSRGFVRTSGELS